MEAPALSARFDRNTPREDESGLKGFISWTRLVDALRAAGEFSDGEQVVHIHAGDAGLTYTVQRPAVTP